MKIKLHPLFLLLTVVMFCFNKGLLLIYGVASVILHELGHYIASKYFGYSLNKICLMPYGAMLYGEENLDSKAESYIAISGPIVSILLALIFIGFWWLIPESYYYTKSLVNINFNLFLINLLPAYPLDGARLILSFSKNKLKSLKRLRVMGIILSIVFIVLFIISSFYSINFSSGIFGIFLFIGATSEVSKKKENYIFNTSFLTKQLGSGVESKNIYVNDDITLLKMLKQLKSNTIVTFIIVDDNFNVLYKVKESELNKLIIKFPLSCKIKNAKV